ncbi:ERG4/ERG24 ergosterol biosynthesis protein [Gonapodya prolifera JEL478]|uniref:Delta(14)-sterol reductase ERG24 n=1 Tax=Gonapodya prolifera (strain JEL478) TaxID=1344416 RepID=A0A139AQR6_GONPJ|nr:ERG4/ERG24 ergosterol biosynthesis protein [Gonapodya prolifera JEL478]|eukprot:KXS19079.1 ERG4/ERG24 ergosterol biosynthesis protein [Gonapodya prolifera JEL478]
MVAAPRVRAAQKKTTANGAAKEKKGGSDLNPRTKHFEFFGPPGAFLITFALPVLVLLLHLGCSSDGCPPPLPVLTAILQSSLPTLWDPQAFLAYVAWLAWFVLLWAIAPGEWADGTLVRDGSVLKYRINAWSSFIITAAAVAGATYIYGLAPLLWITDHFTGLAAASIVYSFAQSLLLYAFSFRPGALLALGGNSGNVLYDFFIGRELNPRILSFDLKCFFELRPGLIGWLLVDIAFLARQHHLHGSLSDSAILVTLFQAYYVMDALWFEKAVLTTIDIIQDGFGYMLTFGDIAWVPFAYSLQVRYLAAHPVHLGPLYATLVLALQLLGMYIFRSANGEKNDFRTDPKSPRVAHLTYMITKTGSRLITSGWWGRARHINYLGDWLMAWAWCLPTGFATPITYFYVVYFGVLLVHRELRDHEKCSNKYGADWDKYCKLVPYRIIPYLY